MTCLFSHNLGNYAMYPGSWNIPLIQAAYLQDASKFSRFICGDQIEYRAHVSSLSDADDLYQKLVDAQPHDKLAAKSHSPELLFTVSLLNLAMKSPKFLKWWSVREDGSVRIEWDGKQFIRTEIPEGGEPGWRLRVQLDEAVDPIDLIEESALEFCAPNRPGRSYPTYKPQGTMVPYGQRVLHGVGCLEATGLGMLREAAGTIERDGHEFPSRHRGWLKDDPLLLQQRYWLEPGEGLKAVISVCLPETPGETLTFPRAEVHLYRYGLRIQSQTVDWSGINAEAWLSCDEFEYDPATLALTGVEPHLKRLKVEAEDLNKRSLELLRDETREPTGFDLCIRPVPHSIEARWQEKVDSNRDVVSVPLLPDGRLEFARDGSGKVTLFREEAEVIDDHRHYRRMVIDTSADLRDTKDIYTVWAAFDDELERPQLAFLVGTVSVYDAGGPGWREQLKFELGECGRLARMLGIPFRPEVSRAKP